jgi:hypothetical protein
MHDTNKSISNSDGTAKVEAGTSKPGTTVAIHVSIDLRKEYFGHHEAARLLWIPGPRYFVAAWSVVE